MKLAYSSRFIRTDLKKTFSKIDGLTSELIWNTKIKQEGPTEHHSQAHVKYFCR